MADVVQWSIDQFWGQLQGLENKIHAVEANLNQDKAELQQAYAATRSDTDHARATANQVLLNQLIHRNSELRLSYLKPVKDKFNEAARIASSVLRSVGYTTPQLKGLGVVIAVAPVAAVVLVLSALAAVAAVAMLTDAQRTRTHALAASLAKAKTAKEVTDILAANTRDMKAEPPPLGFDFGSLVPILGLVAAIMVLPTVLRMMPGRKAVAA